MDETTVIKNGYAANILVLVANNRSEWKSTSPLLLSHPNVESINAASSFFSFSKFFISQRSNKFIVDYLLITGIYDFKIWPPPADKKTSSFFFRQNIPEYTERGISWIQSSKLDEKRPKIGGNLETNHTSNKLVDARNLQTSKGGSKTIFSRIGRWNACGRSIYNPNSVLPPKICIQAAH